MQGITLARIRRALDLGNLSQPRMTEWRIAFAGLLAAVALAGAAAPAQAHHDTQPRCERKYERLESTFRWIEAHVGWEAASWYWNEIGWPHYYKQCGGR